MTVFAVVSAQNQNRGSIDDYNRGYMHDGPDIYMKESKKKAEYESGLADSLLKSLQSPTAASNHQPASSSSYVRISSSGMSNFISLWFIFSLFISFLLLIHIFKLFISQKSAHRRTEHLL